MLMAHIFCNIAAHFSFLFSFSVTLLQSCLTLCHPVDHGSPGSPVQGILQARILEWVAMPSSRGSSWPRDWTHISYISCIGKQVLYHSRHLGSRYSESTCCQHDLGSLSESGTQLFRTFLRRRDFSVVDSAFQCMGPGFNPWSGN